MIFLMAVSSRSYSGCTKSINLCLFLSKRRLIDCIGPRVAHGRIKVHGALQGRVPPFASRLEHDRGRDRGDERLPADAAVSLSCTALSASFLSRKVSETQSVDCAGRSRRLVNETLYF